MKKILTLLLSVCMLFCLGVAAVSCDDGTTDVEPTGGDHKHSYWANWEKDATHHWHACKGEDCDSVIDKDVHQWDEGVEFDGQINYTCDVCEATKTEQAPASKMSLAEWNAMLDMSNFGNFSLVWSLTVDGVEGEYTVKHAEGALQYVLKMNGEEVESVIIPQNSYDRLGEFISVPIAVLAANYEAANYNAAQDKYTVSGTVNAEYIYENGGGDPVTVEVAMTNGVVKANGGKLIELSCDYTETVNNQTTSYEDAVWSFSHYGTTVIDLPPEQLDYEINGDGQSCTVTGIGGMLGDNLVIPEEIFGYTVTAIANDAFCGRELTSVVIPDSVTEIGTYAFGGCGVQEITIGKGITNIYDWGLSEALEKVSYTGTAKEWAQITYNSEWGYSQNYSPTQYAGDLYIDGEAVAEVDLTGVPSVSDYAFYGCASIASVVIPSCVETLGANAFAQCTALSSVYYDVINQANYSGSPFAGAGTASGGIEVTVGASAQVIPNRLFYGGYQQEVAIKSIVFESGSQIRSIGDYAFYTVSGYQQDSLVIPDGVTAIGQNAFGYSLDEEEGRLQSVTLPASLASISQYSLRDVVTTDTVLYFKGYEDDWASDITFDGPVLEYFGDFYVNGELFESFGTDINEEAISDYAFKGCKTLKRINVTYSVSSIGRESFAECPNLESVYIAGGATLRKIGDYAFYRNEKLKAVEIRQVISGLDTQGGELGYGLFSDCFALESVRMSITSVPAYLFSGCSSLTEVRHYQEDGVPTTAVDLTASGITSIGERAFEGCERITSVSLPQTVTSIGSMAFYGCYRLVEIYNRSTVNIVKNDLNSPGDIARYALNIYKNSEDSKLSIDANGFVVYADGAEVRLVSYEGSASAPIVPDTVTAINAYAFYKRTDLNSVKLSALITGGVDRFAFCGCGKELVIFSERKADVGANPSEYEYGWKDDETPVVWSYGGVNGVTEDGFKWALMRDQTVVIYGYEGDATDLVIPSQIEAREVTAIGMYAFSQGDYASAIIPDTVKRLGDYAFVGCWELISVTVGEALEYFGAGALSNCPRLVEIYNKSEASVSGGSIHGVIYTQPYTSKVTVSEDGFVVLHDGDKVVLVRYIGTATTVVIPKDVTHINGMAFFDTNDVTTVVIGKNVVWLGESMFSGWDSQLQKVYYEGTEDEWNSLEVEAYGGPVFNAARYYYREDAPTAEGLYWHWAEDGVTPVEWVWQE